MGKVFRAFKAIIDWGGTIGVVLGWLGLGSVVVGLLVSIGGSVWAVITGVPIPIAIMVGYCTLVGAIYLSMVPMAYRALSNNRAAASTGPKPGAAADYPKWRQVETLTLNEAACLWCGYHPHRRPTEPEIQTRLRILFDAVKWRSLPLELNRHMSPFDQEWARDHPEEQHQITRTSLKKFAESRKEVPRFLRDNDV